ncbi:MAG: hypothetical protein AAB547_00335 [Patescibacteria group bacterium]|mgnify:CR=1 FL=1
MKGIGELHILESKEAVPRTPEIGIDSPEALMQFGEKMRTQVRIEAINVKRDTDTELNDVCAATKLPKQTLYVLRREFDIDGKIGQSFQRVDALAAATEQEISVAATAH